MLFGNQGQIRRSKRSAIKSDAIVGESMNVHGRGDSYRSFYREHAAPIDGKMNFLLSGHCKTLIAVSMSVKLSISFRETAYTSGHVLKLESSKVIILDVFLNLLESFRLRRSPLCRRSLRGVEAGRDFSFMAGYVVARRCLRNMFCDDR